MKILIVDDNADNRMTIELLLEEFEGLELSEVKDGQEAIDLCENEPFDLIFMDIMMPNVNGITATKIIKSFDKKVMIIALSALDDENSKNQILANGAEDYITKPIESDLFHQRVKNYLEIVQLRKNKPSNTDAVNPYTQEVYSRSLKFRIDSAQSLAEFWDYYLNNSSYGVEMLEECIRIIYAYGQVCVKSHTNVSIIAEENEANLYLTISPLGPISDLVVQHTLLKNYKDGPFILNGSQLAFRLPKIKAITKEEAKKLDVTDYEKNILSKTHFDKTPATTYVANTAISLIDKIEDLENIEDALEVAAIAFEQEATQERLIEMTGYLDQYVTVIEQLLDFEHFAYALRVLTSFLKGLDLKSVEEKDYKKFSLLFLHLLDDLGSWRRNIFILREANDVHYLDSSLLSSCLQIQMIFEKSEVDNDEDFELF